MKTEVLSVAETSFLLRAKLGRLRKWTDFLTDCVRDRQSINGLRLMPCARRNDGRSLRPVYALKNILAFVNEVLALVPEAGKAPLEVVVLDVDLSRDWRLNKFARDGSRIAHSSPVSAHTSGAGYAV